VTHQLEVDLQVLAQLIGRCESTAQRADQTSVSVDRLHVPSALDGLRGLPVPRQQLVESIHWVSIHHALEHVAQVGVRLNAIHLARFDQRAECRPSLSTEIRTRQEMVLAPECNGTDGALHRIGIEFDATIVQESREAVPARQRIVTTSTVFEGGSGRSDRVG